VEGLAANPITEEEVDRVRERFRRGAERLAAASDQLALALGSWAGVGDWRLLFLHRDRLEKVTAADVNRVAAAYLTRNNRTVGLRLNLRYGNEESLAGPLTAAGLLSDMLPRGTKKHTRQQLTDAFDKLGARVSFSGGAGVLTVSVQAKRDQLATTLRLVAEV